MTGYEFRIATPYRLACFLVVALLATSCVAQSQHSGTLGEGQPWQTSFYINDSGVEGPTVIITGGIHGNEPAGYRAADQIRHWPIRRGKLIVIPRVNTFGLDADIRYVPEAPEDQKDLNRNFPSPGIADNPRGEIATAVWQFVVEQDPDWVFDLHEGYEFNISHRPKNGKSKSVGSSIIYDRSQPLAPMVERMLTITNSSVSDPDRKFVLRGMGPKKTTLASAVIDVLGKHAMTLETTFNHQPLPIRTRQHRAMISVALRQIEMTDDDLSDLTTPPSNQRDGRVFVAVYSDDGGSNRGVNNVTRVLDASPNLSVVHLDANDIRPKMLSQFDAIVFGGGSGSAQAEAIGKDGAAAVRGFVSNGGGYVGVCGGAFLCSAYYDWSLKLIDTHVFTGKHEVKGLGPKSMYIRGKTTTVKMQLTDQGRKVFQEIPEHTVVSYHNGPIVSPMNLQGLDAYTPLAYFRSEQVLFPSQKGTMIDTPAIVRGEYGSGRVISISPHPEATEGLEQMVAMAVQAVTKQKVATIEVKTDTTKPKKVDNKPAPTIAEVSYGDHERQVLDFWQARSDEPTPLAFVIHGGSWTSGSKERIHNYLNLQRLLDSGISVASINYRYVTQAPKHDQHPPVRTPLYDAARALQFVRSKANEWNLDKSRVGASGASAGACTSLWLAFHDDLAAPNSDDPVARESTRLTCVAVSGAQTTLDPKQMKEWTPNSRYGGHAFGVGKFDNFLGQREHILPWIQEYSPYANVTVDDPPVALFYKNPPALGKPQKDPTHTGNFGVKLQEHCHSVGTECYLYYSGSPDHRHTSKTSYLIERLHRK